MRMTFSLLLVCLMLAPALGQDAPAGDASRNVILWINIDGLRGDYVDRGKPPTLTRLMREGAYSRQLKPVFPSLTFPTHMSLATGTPVSGHGIPGNSFYDADDQQIRNYPADHRFHRGEAIWTTATRQGVRVSVIDWPVSHRQQGPHAAAYFGQAYDGSLSDEQRLQMAITPYLVDQHDQPLQLVMGYTSKVDTVGHQHGPDSPEVLEELKKTDALIDSALQQITKRFERKMGPNDELYLIITTDHGMSNVTHQASAERMLGPTFSPEVTIVTSGSVAFVHLDKLPADHRDVRRDAMIEQLKKFEFASTYTRAQAGEKYGLDDPTRVGHLIISLDKGYTFSRLRAETVIPVTPRGPLGMHGYPAETNPEMNGFMLVWRLRNKLGGVDLGEVDSLQLHPTVARLLHIDPAPAAKADPIHLP